MLSFKHEKGKFNYRAVGVATHNERVLIHRAEADDFWALPGGRVEFGESASDALVREFNEEISVAVRVKRLLWVMENFFEHNGLNFHEVSLYFLVDLPDDSAVLENDEFMGNEEGVKLIFRWCPLSKLKGIKLFPTLLQSGLIDIPEFTQYVVHRD